MYFSGGSALFSAGSLNETSSAAYLGELYESINF